MKTLLLVLMPLLLFGGCVHKVPVGHTIAYRQIIPVYHKVLVAKKEHIYSPVREKKLRRYKEKHKQRQISHPNSHSYSMNQRPKTKKQKVKKAECASAVSRR